MRTKQNPDFRRRQENVGSVRGKSRSEQMAGGYRYRRRRRFSCSALPADGRRGQPSLRKWQWARRAPRRMTKRPSKFFEDRIKERPAFSQFPSGNLLRGGVPIMYQNECVGAIGVSGVQSHEDEEVAQAGASEIG